MVAIQSRFLGLLAFAAAASAVSLPADAPVEVPNGLRVPRDLPRVVIDPHMPRSGIEVTAEPSSMKMTKRVGPPSAPSPVGDVLQATSNNNRAANLVKVPTSLPKRDLPVKQMLPQTLPPNVRRDESNIKPIVEDVDSLGDATSPSELLSTQLGDLGSRDAVPQPLEHIPIDRNTLGQRRHLLETIVNPLDTIINAGDDQSFGDRAGKMDDTALGASPAVKKVDKNDADVFQTHSEKHKDGFENDDVALTGTRPSAEYQTAHLDRQQEPDGKVVDSSNFLGGDIQQNTQKGGANAKRDRHHHIEHTHSHIHSHIHSHEHSHEHGHEHGHGH